MNSHGAALASIRRPAICGEAGVGNQLPGAKGRGKRMGFGQNNEALLASLGAPVFEDPVGQACFDFGFDPGFDERPELFTQICNCVEAGQFKGFERGLGTTKEVFDVAPGLAHGGSPGSAGRWGVALRS